VLHFALHDGKNLAGAKVVQKQRSARRKIQKQLRKNKMCEDYYEKLADAEDEFQEEEEIDEDNIADFADEIESMREGQD